MATSTPLQVSASRIVFPLALCQFIASYACTNMNVAISNIAKDLGTTVLGVQTAITLFTLTMAALMIPGSKVTDRWGRRFCFMLGLVIYGAGAVIATISTSLPILIIGYSLLEGIGSALMIPPIYIIITVLFTDLPERAKAFGVVSAAAGVGAAAGPLIGGVITSTIGWRFSFLAQVLVVAAIIFITYGIKVSRVNTPQPRFDVIGTVLSAAGLVLVVMGVLQTATYGWFRSRADWKIGNHVIIPKGDLSPVWIFFALGAVAFWLFFAHSRSLLRSGREPLLAPRLFRSRTSNLGLLTQNTQWLVLQGAFFVVSVFLQEIRHYSAISTGLVLTPATIGTLTTGALAGRMAKRRSQRSLIIAGFLSTIVGILLLLLFVRVTSNILTFVPGLLLMGMGVGVMLTSSVNVVQGAFPEKDQGEISGLSRSVSNLGSSFGTAIAGSVLVSDLVTGNKHFALAMVTLIGFATIGLAAGVLLPRDAAPAASAS